jgi:hypothetical protein
MYLLFLVLVKHLIRMVDISIKNVFDSYLFKGQEKILLSCLNIYEI